MGIILEFDAKRIKSNRDQSGTKTRRNVERVLFF